MEDKEMGFISRLIGKGDKEESPKKSLQGKSQGNPSITIWVRDQNPDEILLTTLLIRLNSENPTQIPQDIRDRLDKKIPYKNIRFIKKPNVSKGGTNVTCIFEQ
jgi:hypothetical protein